MKNLLSPAFFSIIQRPVAIEIERLIKKKELPNLDNKEKLFACVSVLLHAAAHTAYGYLHTSLTQEQKDAALEIYDTLAENARDILKKRLNELTSSD